MNELQRQAYLSALGIENYMPKWQLPFAPAARQCDSLPSILDENITSESNFHEIVTAEILVEKKTTVLPDLAASHQLLADINAPVAKPVRITAASIMQQLEQTPQEVLRPFALSIWRPRPGCLIIDSRNTALALPTELLLHNILRAWLGQSVGVMQEEVLRWPMVENRFVSRTAADARTELQTWLAVENELRPVDQLWLMGENAARYFLPADVDTMQAWWQKHTLAESGLHGLILPGLNQLLQQPLLKAQLWSVIRTLS
jgi:hypothetical protein